MKAQPDRRLTRKDWLAFGLDLLGRAGPTALTIDRLCAKARKTRGSFYHHFRDHDAFIQALLEYWRDRHTETLIRAVDSASRPGNRLRLLNTLAAALDPRTEIAIRRLAGIDIRARSVLAQVDRRRIDYLAGLHLRTGRTGKVEAKALAELEYAIYVGLHHLDPDASPEKIKALYETFGQLISHQNHASPA